MQKKINNLMHSKYDLNIKKIMCRGGFYIRPLFKHNYMLYNKSGDNNEFI